jgi:signal transduction histidine kinase
MSVELATGEVSRHKCLIYDGDPSEQLPVIVPLLREGLAENRRCLYLGSPEMVDMVGLALKAKGVDVDGEGRRGALIFSSDRSHLDNGFQPKAMVDMLCRLIDDAVRDGFQGLCATGDMRWELGTDENFEKLLEYEALLETVFREKPLKGICQYHRDTVPASAVQDALQSHRSAYLGSVLNRDNLFYIPPEVLLARGDAATRAQRADWMYRQISRILRAETERDSALAALERTNKDLESRVRERTAELEAVNRELESFSYSVSHDLRAPLRAIDGFSALLAEEFSSALGDEGREHVERVRGGVRRMAELIDGMLVLSRAAKKEMTRRPVDLTAIAETVARELRAAAPDRKAEFVIDRGLRTTGDESLLRAALDNLFGNAWKFTSKNASARIEFGRAAGQLGENVFVVRDDGAGFSMDYAHKLFGAFQRLHAQEEFPGTGVGLVTVQRIIARHGGRIWAEGAPGKGAAFYFTLP